ncbi:MAG: hypothetical protein GX610_08580 [Rhodococcus sp.]|nr:hypothetical protein [Rhodococcus sp. (in: high G+C Gram-positive bacteria)]
MSSTDKHSTDGVPMICISGGDASGKSTQVAALAAALAADGRSVAEVSIWDAFTDPHVASKLPFGRREDVFAYLRILGPGARAHFLFHALHVALDLALEQSPDIVLLNAHWYKYFATEVAHGGDPEVLRAWTEGFPVPDLTFFLEISPETALSRKEQRSDYESGYGDAVAFVEFQTRSQEVLAGLCTELGWTRLDGTGDPKKLTARMLAAVRDEVLR